MLTLRRLTKEVVALFTIGGVVHLAVLRWIFPGYLDSPWPRHG